MTKIEKTVREVNDLYEFYNKIQKPKKGQQEKRAQRRHRGSNHKT